MAALKKINEEEGAEGNPLWQFLLKAAKLEAANAMEVAVKKADAMEAAAKLEAAVKKATKAAAMQVKKATKAAQAEATKAAEALSAFVEATDEMEANKAKKRRIYVGRGGWAKKVKELNDHAAAGDLLLIGDMPVIAEEALEEAAYSEMKSTE